MSAPKHDLAQIQRWLQSVITHPGGVLSGMQTDAARAQLDVRPADIASVILPSQRQDSIERLEIYAQAYFARLLECLRAEFPVMVKAMGEELFDEFAVGFLERYPSQSYTLDHLGARFPQFLAETRPVDESGTSWLDFLADLARLEWNIAEVFDGPGAEGQPLLDKEQILAIPPDRWSEARLRPVPCLRVVRLDFPVHEYYRALRHDEADAVPPDRAETRLAITRRNYVVRHLPLSGREAEVLVAILGGATVGEAIAGVRVSEEAEVAHFASELQTWFRTWSAEGFFLRVELGPESA